MSAAVKVSSDRLYALVGMSSGVIALACLALPFWLEDEHWAFVLYQVAAVCGGLAIVLCVGALIAGRLGWKRGLGCVLAALFGAYAILHDVVASIERERVSDVLACAIRLSDLRARVVRYCHEHGKYPTQMEDLCPSQREACRCPACGGEFVLWPEGVPTGRPFVNPLSFNFVVAREAEPAHRSSWLVSLVPWPHFSYRSSDERLCESYPQLADALVANRKEIERKRHMFLGLPCEGPIQIDASGGISIPRSAHVSIHGLRLPNSAWDGLSVAPDRSR